MFNSMFHIVLDNMLDIMFNPIYCQYTGSQAEKSSLIL